MRSYLNPNQLNRHAPNSIGEFNLVLDYLHPRLGGKGPSPPEAVSPPPPSRMAPLVTRRPFGPISRTQRTTYTDRWCSYPDVSGLHNQIQILSTIFSDVLVYQIYKIEGNTNLAQHLCLCQATPSPGNVSPSRQVVIGVWEIFRGTLPTEVVMCMCS